MDQHRTRPGQAPSKRWRRQWSHGKCDESSRTSTLAVTTSSPGNARAFVAAERFPLGASHGTPRGARTSHYQADDEQLGRKILKKNSVVPKRVRFYFLGSRGADRHLTVSVRGHCVAEKARDRRQIRKASSRDTQTLTRPRIGCTFSRLPNGCRQWQPRVPTRDHPARRNPLFHAGFWPFVTSVDHARTDSTPVGATTKRVILLTFFAVSFSGGPHLAHTSRSATSARRASASRKMMSSRSAASAFKSPRTCV